MKRLINIIVAMLFCCMVVAQPSSWAKKAVKSLFTIKTFDANGALLGSGNGFFIGENGEAVSNCTPFIGAAKAIVIDAGGKQYDVDRIVGANEIYDVAQFHVNIKRSLPLSVATTADVESVVFILPYAQKIARPIESKVTKIEKVGADYSYYTITFNALDNRAVSEKGNGSVLNGAGSKKENGLAAVNAVGSPVLNAVGSPVLNAAGEVVGMLQAAMDGERQYAVSVKMATDFKPSPLAINDPTLRQIKIKKALPDDVEEALVALYLGTSNLDSLAVNTLIDDFITKFPTSIDGYAYRADRAFRALDFKAADDDLLAAIKMGEKKEYAHYNYAKMMFDKLVYLPEKPFDAWTLDKAKAEIDQAIAIADEPGFGKLNAQILFAQKKYDESAKVYQSLVDRGDALAENYYGMARCKAMLKDTTACLAMLDSAVATFSRPYLKEAGFYILERGKMLMDMGKYRLAVNDLNDYEQLMITHVNDNFYYLRSQAEVSGRLFKQALDDLDKALSLSPGNTLYLSEKASLQLRVGLTDDAMATAKECIKVNPDLSDGYLFLGVAQCVKGMKDEGLKNLEKAKTMGEPQAQAFIEKYSK